MPRVRTFPSPYDYVIVPFRGTEISRQVAKLNQEFFPGEIHVTIDQRRVFVNVTDDESDSDRQIGTGVYHGEVADEDGMLALSTSSSFGVWPFDMCKRADIGTVWMCISNNGGLASDWLEFPIGADGIDGYELPIASDTVLGGVKIGEHVIIDIDGVITVQITEAGTLGVMKPGIGLEMDASEPGQVNLAKATGSTLGGIIPGDGLQVDPDGVLSIVTSAIGVLLTLTWISIDTFETYSVGVVEINRGLSWAGAATFGDITPVIFDTFESYSPGATLIDGGTGMLGSGSFGAL